MKVNFKRVASAALAVAMSLSLSVPAFAAEVASGSLTVTGHELTGKNVFAVRMFTATATTPDVGDSSDPSYTYTNYELEDEWLPFFKAATEPGVTESDYQAAGITIPQQATDDDYMDAAIDYVEWLATGGANKESDWADFAEEAQDWLYTQNFITEKAEPETGIEIDRKWTTLASMQTATAVVGDEDQPVTPPTGQAYFESLSTGYYVVFPEGGSTGNAIPDSDPAENRGTDAMLINIPTGNINATWNIKSTFPTVDKKVDTDNDGEGQAADNGSAQVGDTVTFTLTSKVPDMSDYKTFYFAFIDTLSKGLDLSIASDTFAETDVTVYIYNAEDGEKADEDHRVGTEAFNASFTDSSKTLKVEFPDLKAVKVKNANVEAGDTIQVVYKATINEEAVTGQGNAENSVKLEYSNDPSGDGHGISTPDITKVYTYDIDVNKWSSDMTTPNLAGAVFKLTRDEEGNNVVNLIATDETDSEDATDLHNAYRVAKPGEESGEGYTTTFTTDDDGNINIAGLEAGTYYLHEVTAPSGYNKLKDPITIVITMTDPETGDATITVDDEELTEGDGTTVDVENKKGIELPETGSIGTIGLTALGVVVVVAGLFAFPRKKKTRQD